MRPLTPAPLLAALVLVGACSGSQPGAQIANMRKQDPAACPEFSTWDGKVCAQLIVSQIECPAGTKLDHGKCVTNAACAAGSHFEFGKAFCMPDVAAASGSAPAVASPAPTVASGSCAAGMASLAGGTFKMGERGDDVDVQPFCLDLTEVTVDAFGACVRAGQCSANNLRTQFWGDTNHGKGACNWGFADRGNHPINCVDWNQARAYCGAQSKRLPTEEEWEYAARGGSNGGKYPWGNVEPGSLACWSGVSKRSGTCLVGRLSQGDAPGGIHDLAGNVFEWTSSNYNTNKARANRGGAWSSGDAFDLGAASRGWGAPSARDDALGFRCARAQ